MEQLDVYDLTVANTDIHTYNFWKEIDVFISKKCQLCI